MGFASPLSGTAVTGTVAVSSVPPIVVESGTIDASGSTVDLAAGTTVAIAGTPSVDIGNTPAVTVESGSVDIGNTPAVTVDGPVGIAEGSSIEIVNSNLEGQTTPSASGSTTTGNAALSATDYNLVSWPSVPLPAGSAGNLVYDSNLENAIAAVGPTWFEASSFSTPVGTDPGDMTVRDAGTDAAAVVFYCTGTAAPNYVRISSPIDVVPGATYTLSALIDASATTGGTPAVQVMSLDLGTQYGIINQATGGSGQVSGTVTIPSGVTQVVLAVNSYAANAPSGDTVTWSQIQLTETSTVQPYEPGPLWTYPVYRETGGAYGLIGTTTALALKDTGQTAGAPPPALNTSNPTLPAPDAPSITPEGTTGTTTYNYVITAQTNAAVGTVVLGQNPGVNIGTIDIADGASVQIAAGEAAIGTVDLAAGAAVDATIKNATLDVTGSNVTVENASGSVLSTIVTEEVIAGPQPQSILGGVATVPEAASPIVIVPAVSGQSIRLFSFILTSNGSGFIYMALQTTGGSNLLAIPPAASGVATPFPLIVPPAGIVLPAGEGIQLVQDNASATQPAYYSLAYTQAADP